MPTQTPIQVVAALIWDDLGRLLICRRPAHKARGLLWEFPGGKVDMGESHQEALIRECEEELAVTLSVGELYTEVTHQYPDLRVALSFYHARIARGIPQKLEHADIHWERPSKLGEYEFCPADTEMIQQLIQESVADEEEKNIDAKLQPKVILDTHKWRKA